MTTSARLHPRPAGRALYLVATDVAGRTSLLAGPYPSASAAAAGARLVGARLAATPALAGFGHLTIAGGAGGAATYFGRP
jgi:hypothetical protein